MLNITDIRERLQRNPEPIEVTNIRENILNTFNKLEFIEDEHRYFLPRENGTKEELISVSAVTHLFEQKVDWDEKAHEYALKHNMEYEEVKRMWLENNLLATNSGTGTHLYGEMWTHFLLDEMDKVDPVIAPQYEKGYLIPHSGKEKAVMHFYEDLFKVDSIYPVLAETRVYIGLTKEYDLKTKYAGTFDMLFATKYHGEWKLLVYDFKTNSKLTSDYNRQNNVMMLPPFENYYDEALSHYTIQLSAYSLCLQQLGYEILDRKLIWLKEDETYEKISLPDISQDIKKALA